MSTALSIVAANTGASEEDIKNVISGMIISSKNQHGATASNAEIAVFTGVCSKYALNPLVKECAAFVSGGKLQVIVMVDGWYKMVNRQDSFDGVEFEDKLDKDGKIIAITCKMHVKNRSHPVCVTEYMDECFDVKSTVWKKWPNRMLRHKAYIQTARIAFGISEVIDDDEAGRIRGNSPAERDITPKPSVNYTDIEIIMAECDDLDALKELCGSIRDEMQANGTWDGGRANIIALNVKHKDRINSGQANKEAFSEAIYDSETGEDITQAQQSAEAALEGELLASDDGVTHGNIAVLSDDDDSGFGEHDDDKDEFGE